MDAPERARLLSRAYETFNENEGKSDTRKHLLSGHVFDLFVKDNLENLTHRPTADNGRVQLSKTGMERMDRLVEQYDADIGAYIKKPDFPLVGDLWAAFKALLQFVPFDQFLEELEGCVHGFKPMVKRLAKTSPTTLLCLALPSSRVDKSNMWFTAYLWQHTYLSKYIDFIVPSTMAAERLCAALGKEWNAVVFFVDDMLYSGSQFVNFDTPSSDIVSLIPLAPYVSDRFIPNTHIWGSSEARRPRKSVFSRTVMSVRQFLSETSDMSLVGHRAIDKLTSFPGHDKCAIPPHIFTFYKTFLDILDFPCLVFEHKLADNVSMSTRFFAQRSPMPGEGESPADLAARQLVTIGDGSELVTDTHGSTAFYKKLTWRYKGVPLKDTVSFQSQLVSVRICARCCDVAVGASTFEGRTNYFCHRLSCRQQFYGASSQ